ncbi:MAG: cyclic peptide export ABC transporter [Pseudomonadota bacterium]
MSTLTTFSQKAPNRVFVAILFGALAGVFYAALIPLVLSSIQSEDVALVSENNVQTLWIFDIINYKLAAVYLAACVLILLMRSASEIMLVRVATEISQSLRKKFYQKISKAPLVAIEKIGSAKLIGSINIDVPRIVSGGMVLPALLISMVTLIGMLGFLVFLNFDVFRLVILSISIGVICFQIPMYFGRKILHRSREAYDELQHSIKGLIYGAKELKLDGKKRETFFKKSLLEREDKILNYNKKAQTILKATMCFGDLICFFVIGAFSFIFVNYYSVSQTELVGVIMALIYVIGPVGVILATIPTVTVASISYRKLNNLINDIPSENAKDLDLNNIPLWNKLSFENIIYQYSSSDDESGFKVGPLSFEIEKGKVTFVVGGNGSGKSTLSKLLTLHYKPISGKIYFDSQEVTEENINNFRFCIGAIYSDYYLFDELHMELDDELSAKARQYLSMLNLSHKVEIKDGYFTTLDLSDGQRKRLALLVSLLENKELYLLDEWAADQDPEFKEIFYRKILKELKAQGKAIVVISHDNAYFDCADNIITMDNGSINVAKTSPQSLLNRQNTFVSESLDKIKII